jgi:hypothetical protein
MQICLCYNTPLKIVYRGLGLQTCDSPVFLLPAFYPKKNYIVNCVSFSKTELLNLLRGILVCPQNGTQLRCFLSACARREQALLSLALKRFISWLFALDTFKIALVCTPPYFSPKFVFFVLPLERKAESAGKL